MKPRWAVAGLLLPGFTIAAIALAVPGNTRELLAVTAQNQSVVRIDEVSCLSIESRDQAFNGKKYSDPKLVEAIGNILSIKRVLFNADVAICPWAFHIVGENKTISAVRHDGKLANYLISVGICERTSNGRANPNKCISKNIYVFNRRVDTHRLFSLALVGLAKKQVSEWEALQSGELE
ncbi:hypothetical protein YH63_002110 [Afipia massiliensis]|uniref:Uncharacterized protein n=1 Tax=Afipia massiliensis TaxID=211460 RepID=A0A4U6BJI9_9BRAD|nr:hypothetical protein [Afipia massiliensis]TKT70299.1 hypothetical protein YH63_002110 [Afipia massiliensis]